MARDEDETRERRVEVHEEPALRRDPDAGIHAARERFGGIDLPAALVGMLTALALLVILGGIVGGAMGAFGYQTGLRAEEVTIAGLIAGLVVLFVSFLLGGWAAGRMARYDGLRNGILTVIFAIVLIAILSALAAWLGTQYDVLRDANLPRWFSRDVLTSAGILSAIVAVVVALVAGALGGMWGERYHRRADREILAPRAA